MIKTEKSNISQQFKNVDRKSILSLSVRPVFLMLLAITILSVSAYIFMPRFTSDLMLAVIEWRAKVDINYSECETRGFFWVRYKDLTVQRSSVVKVIAKEAIIQYNILDLIFKRFDLKLDARDIEIKSQEPSSSSSIMDSFDFKQLVSQFRLASKRRVRIDFLRLSGNMGSVFVKGHFQEGVVVDLVFSCFLSRDFLKSLPAFIQENLFRENELPLKNFQFSLSGKWSQPSIDFKSDLIVFNFTSKS